MPIDYGMLPLRWLSPKRTDFTDLNQSTERIF